MKFNLFSFAPRAFQQRHLDTDDGHQVFYARYGNPKGQMVVCFHGGPGGSGRVKKHNFNGFDLKKYQMLFINQRGCGISLPTGKIDGNNTDNLIKDTKDIIDETGYKGKIILKGVSWGSTLALLFAQKYPKLVDKLILSQILLARQANHDWLYNDAEIFYPDLLNKIKSNCRKGETIVDCYHRLIFSDTILDQKEALEYLGCYERIIGSLSPKIFELDEVSEADIAKFRIYMHYEKNKYFIKENQIIENMHKIRQIPAIIVHNRLDFVCPLKGAYDLAKEFDDVKLSIVAEKGHVGDLLYDTLAKRTEEFLA
jgi:proline iminopeptidase